ncbi:MAG: adenylosuccinate synthetase, partial [Planctomycetota bacterium]
VPGWTEELGSVREFGDLPGNTRRLVERIESLVGAPVSILGVGPERSQVVVRGGAARLVDEGTARRGVGAGS